MKKRLIVIGLLCLGLTACINESIYHSAPLPDWTQYYLENDKNVKTHYVEWLPILQRSRPVVWRYTDNKHKDMISILNYNKKSITIVHKTW